MKAIKIEKGQACSSIMGVPGGSFEPIGFRTLGKSHGRDAELWSSSGWGWGVPIPASCGQFGLSATPDLELYAPGLTLCLVHPRTFISTWDFGLLHGLWTWFNPLVLVAQQPMMGNSLPQPQVLSSYSCFRPKGGVRLLLPLCVPLFFNL